MMTEDRNNREIIENLRHIAERDQGEGGFIRSTLRTAAARIEAIPDPALIERASKLAYATDFSPDDIGGEFGTCSYRNPDGPEIFAMLRASDPRPVSDHIANAGKMVCPVNEVTETMQKAGMSYLRRAGSLSMIDLGALWRVMLAASHTEKDEK